MSLKSIYRSEPALMPAFAWIRVAAMSSLVIGFALWVIGLASPAPEFQALPFGSASSPIFRVSATFITAFVLCLTQLLIGAATVRSTDLTYERIPRFLLALIPSAIIAAACWFALMLSVSLGWYLWPGTLFGLPGAENFAR